jgi:hypothetical protein
MKRGSLVLAAIVASACSAPAPRASPDPVEDAVSASSPAPVPSDLAALPPDVAAAYHAAREAVWHSDHTEARRQLTIAVGLMPDFTEGWYNLGAATSRLSVEAAGRGDDAAALSLFREAVDAKRHAESLIAQGRWLVYGPEQQAAVQEDLRHALEDADEVMANEEALLIALRLTAQSGAAR